MMNQRAIPGWCRWAWLTICRPPHGRLSSRGAVVPLALLLALLLAWPLVGHPQEERLLERISNEKLIALERQLEAELNTEVQRYLEPEQYVLSVRVIWDRNIIPPVTVLGLSQEKYKLPGVPIFVRPPGAPVEEKLPPFERLVVKVLIDETLPDYTERFLRKIIPIVAHFVPQRGDQLIILKETFPEWQRGSLLPPRTESERLGALGQSPGEDSATGQPPLLELARLAYEEGRYAEALQIVRRGFQTAESNYQRAQYLALEGSLHYTMQNPQSARAAWERALDYNPSDLEVREVLNFLASARGAPR